VFGEDVVVEEGRVDAEALGSWFCEGTEGSEEDSVAVFVVVADVGDGVAFCDGGCCWVVLGCCTGGGCDGGWWVVADEEG